MFRDTTVVAVCAGTCGVTARFANMDRAIESGWIRNDAGQWLCTRCGADDATETPLPFTLRAPTKDEEQELLDYMKE